MGRTLVVGDIHGALKALKQVLERANVNEKDHLIFLGDYVDGWGESAQVIDYLILLNNEWTCTFLRGNHDELAYDWLTTGEMNESWLRHGGRKTMESYKEKSNREVEVHLEFYQSMINYRIDPKKRLFLHAGFQKQDGPQYEFYENLVYWDRTLWEMACALDPNISKEDDLYPKRLKLFDEIYIGHTPVTRIGYTTPVKKGNVWNVDTGAAFKGSITIMDIDSKEFWQSEPVHLLYPDENGRN